MSVHPIDDPPPAPGVTPEPADPVPDSIVASTGIAASVIGLVVVLLWWRWLKRRRFACG